jgi:hypothetical protein
MKFTRQANPNPDESNPSCRIFREECNAKGLAILRDTRSRKRVHRDIGPLILWPEQSAPMDIADAIHRLTARGWVVERAEDLGYANEEERFYEPPMPKNAVAPRPQ